MSYEPVLGIDLGASYTKVALRSESGKPNAQTFFTRLLGQVPSLGIRDFSRGKDQWIFGEPATELVPGPKSTVHENWKADLFSTETSGRYPEAVIVAHKFFEWLYRWLDSHHIDAAAQRVRLCVPALENVEPYASTVAQIMEASGWRGVDILKIPEPRANVVGLMSGGRNCLLTNSVPGYGPMYQPGSDFAQWVLGMLHHNRSPIVRVCVIDVGSFTTDLASIVVNLQTDAADGITTVTQHSWQHGIINQLDKFVLPRVCARHSVNWDSMRVSEREFVKKELYAGNVVAVPSATLGDAVDRQTVDNGITRFSTELWQKLQDDVLQFRPEFAYLTGGGTRIADIAHRLTGFLSNQTCHVIPAPEADARSTNEPTERVATALGAASLILDAVEPSIVTEAPFTMPAHLEPGFVACRCQGGNKDCCFCWGRGYYRRAT